MTVHATIDFETRSACDLKKHGSWVYSRHETTEAMCLAYRLPHWKPGRVDLWHMAHPEHGIRESKPPQELFDWIADGGLVEAHNAFFERVIWRNVMVRKHDWPEMPHLQWRCSASRASASSLPRDLENACKAMGLAIEKDMEGRRLMLKMSKPRKPRKAEVIAWMEDNFLSGDYRKYTARMVEEAGPFWHSDPDDLERLWAYCQQDVRAEEALSEVIPHLSDRELQLWQLDQQINERGARFDLPMAHAAIRLASQAKRRMNRELEKLTGIKSATQRAAVKDWLARAGVELPDTTADTVDKFLARSDVGAREKRVLQILKDVNRTSTRKYTSCIDKTDHEDGRARDLLMYHGASTGRWSGKGIQVQNFPRGTSKNSTYFDKKSGHHKAKFDMDVAAADIIDEDDEWIEAVYDGGTMEGLSSALRGLVIPSEDHELIVADYAAIEARCVLGEAGAEAARNVFRTGGDIYCDMAEGIYGYPVNKHEHPDERQFGKQAILGLGYGMGFLTFLLTCRKYGITFSVAQVKGILKDKYLKYYDWVDDYLFPKPRDEEDPKAYSNRKRNASKTRRQLTDADEDPKAIIHELALMKYTVDVYRTRYPEVKQMWADQEAAAIAAVREWEELVQRHREELQFEWELENGPLDDTNVSFSLMPWERDNVGDHIEGPVHVAGCMMWYVKGGFLCGELPSGRLLRYRSPSIKPTRTSWGAVKDGLRYMSIVTGNKWARTSTYGGKIVENITQAVARDVMADAMLAMRGTKYVPLMTVHDELVCEVPRGQGDVEEFEELMAHTESWADGCPIAAEGAIMQRYRK